MESRDLLSITPILAEVSGPVIPPAVSAAATGTLTPHEIARERFTAALAGKYIVGNPPMTDQVRQFRLIATGSSSASFHVETIIRLFTPKDPTQPVTGIASIIPRNIAQTGSILILDLTGSTSSLDRFGRPTHMTWTSDTNSGGLFTNTENGFGTGQGTLDITYSRKSPPPNRGASAGGVKTIFKGMINTSGVTNTLVYNIQRF
jgi:hypothetical protein